MRLQFLKYKSFKHLFRDYNTVYLNNTTWINTKQLNHTQTDIEIESDTLILMDEI